MIALLVLLAVGMAKASSPVAQRVANPRAPNEALVGEAHAPFLSEPRTSFTSGASGDVAAVLDAELPTKTIARTVAADVQKQPN